jgi:galactose mutarotase-like enzyme
MLLTRMFPRSSTYERTINQGTILCDTLTDDAAGLCLVVSRLGGELISLKKRDATGKWIAFLYRDDDTAHPAKGWANHATVMGYYLHRIKNERTEYRGREIRGGTHSFLRTKIWRRVESDSDRALTYRITPADFSATEYALKVSLDLTYRIDGSRLVVLFRFHNAEPKLTAHVGFGLHPGFAATSFESFRFKMPAGVYRRHFSPENYLSGETEDIRFNGGEMPFPKANLPGSYILELADVPERIFTYIDPPTGRATVLDLTGVPYLTLWSDGGPFLCVEPCWGLTDHHQQRAFENKEGIQQIAPGEDLVASFSIELHLV